MTLQISEFILYIFLVDINLEIQSCEKILMHEIYMQLFFNMYQVSNIVFT